MSWRCNSRSATASPSSAAREGAGRREAPGARRRAHPRLRDAPIDLALAQFAETYSEDKLAGVLALAEIHMDRLTAADAPRLAEPFAHIDDWSTCDWYCVKVLGPLIARDPAAAEPIAAWMDAPGLWQRRAAAVAFVNAGRRGLRRSAQVLSGGSV